MMPWTHLDTFSGIGLERFCISRCMDRANRR
jgi:hypothetical protein